LQSGVPHAQETSDACEH